MVPEAPDDLVVVGDGALMAALTRSRGARMRDIVATIQRHQDEAIRAPRPRRHRDHRRPRHRQDRRRPAPRGLPALLRPAAVRVRRHPRRRPLGRLHGLHRAGAARRSARRASPCAARRRRRRRHTERLDPPAVGARSRARLRIRTLLGARRPRTRRPDAPDRVPRHASPARRCGSRRAALDRVRAQVLRQHQRNHGHRGRPGALGEAAWASLGITGDRDAKAEFIDRCGGPPRRRRVHAGLVAPGRPARGAALARRPRRSCAATPGARSATTRCDAARRLDSASPSRPAPGRSPTSPSSTTSPPGSARSRTRRAEERGFYEIEELEDLSQYGVTEVRAGVDRARRAPARTASAPTDPRERLLAGPHRQARRVRPRPRRRGPGPLAHAVADARPPRPVRVVDRRRRRRPGLVARRRRGRPRPARRPSAPRRASCSTWTPTTATPARSSTTPPRSCARRCPTPTSRRPCARPGSSPVEAAARRRRRWRRCRAAVERCSARSRARSRSITPRPADGSPRPSSCRRGSSATGRVQVIDPMSTKGLEYDADGRRRPRRDHPRVHPAASACSTSR